MTKREQELDQALRVWCRWYSRKLDSGKDYCGPEQDLYEACGCLGVPEDKGKKE